MAREIQPIGGRPLLFKKSSDYTKIAVHKVTALDGNTYNMIYTGTGALAEFTITAFFKNKVDVKQDSRLNIIALLWNIKCVCAFV